jgi:hypothetical protein
MTRLSHSAIACLFLASGLSASSQAVASALFINDATVHTMGPRGTLQRADVLVRDGRVKAVDSELPVPPDATVIEAEGRPLTPGFFAGVSQLGLVEIIMEKSRIESPPFTEGLRPEMDVARAYDPRSSLIPVTRIEGYSWTVLGASRHGAVVGGEGRAVMLDGGVDSFIGRPLLFFDIGTDASAAGAGPLETQWMLLEQVLAEAALAAESKTRLIPNPLLTLAGRSTVESYRHGGITVFDVDRARDILGAIGFAARHSMKPVIHGGAEAWMVADRLAEAGVPVLIDALENLPGDFDRLGARLDAAAILHAAGVTVAFGGLRHSSHNARKLRQLAGNAVSHGLPYEAGLAAMTVNPAVIFELGQDFGTLEAGSRADLVLWSDDPLEVTSLAEQVVIGGRTIPMVSRQTMLRDRYLEEHPAVPRAYLKP